MSEGINDGGPAFPCPTEHLSSGMSPRAHAAIKLRVPNSGIDWLDEMITAANRDCFAGQALAGFHANPDCGTDHADKIASWAFESADAMLKARVAK